MKTYKINNKEITEKELEELIAMKNRKSEARFFFPEKDEEYSCVGADGTIYTFVNDSPIDKDNRSMGVYKTEEQAQKATERQKAIVAMWKWCYDNNVDTDVNWIDESTKYYPVYIKGISSWETSYEYVHQKNFELPHFKSKEDCENFIKHNTDNLNKLL